MNKKQLIVAWVIALFLLTGCATVYNPATGRQDKIAAFITPEVETILGYYFYIDACKRYGGVYSDARLNNIGRNVATVSGRKKDFKYHFVVVNDRNPNAFTASGGYVYATKGLMDMATDDELASIVAHELGHDACRHMAKRIPALIGIYTFDKIISKKDENENIKQIVSAMYQVIASGYSRQNEREADKLAVSYTKGAGYNPEAFITFFQKLQNLERMYGVSGNSLTATHPPTSERIRNARAEIASLTSNSSYAYNNNITQNAFQYVKSKGLRASNENVAAGLYSSVGGQMSSQVYKANWGKMQKGINTEQVISLLGEPLNREWEENYRISKLIYTDGGYLVLSRKEKTIHYSLDYWKEPKWK